MTVKDAYAILKKEYIKGKKLKIIECLEFDDFYGFFIVDKELDVSKNVIIGGAYTTVDKSSGENRRIQFCGR